MPAAVALVHMSVYTLYNIERGLYHSIDITLLHYLACKYDVKVGDFFEGVGDYS